MEEGENIVSRMADEMIARMTPAQRVQFEAWQIKAQAAAVERSTPGTEERAMREARLDFMQGNPPRRGL